MPTTLHEAAISRAHSLISQGKIDHGEWSAPSEGERQQDDCAGSEKSYPLFKGNKLSAKGVSSALGRARTDAPALVGALEGLDNAIKAKKPTALDGDGHDYASCQVHLPPDLADKVKSIGRSIPDHELAEDGRENHPHITVKYGLHHDSASRVKSAVADEMPPRFTTGPMDVFPATTDKPSDTLVASVHSPDLHRLNQKISAAVPHTDTHTEYRPHVTIAHLKSGEGMKYVGRRDLDGVHGMAEKIVHSTRDGEKTEIPLTARSTKLPKVHAGAEVRCVVALDEQGEGQPMPMGLVGLPQKNSEGEPIFYRRVLVAPVGNHTNRGTGQPLPIPLDRAKEWVRNTKSLIAAGVYPFLTTKHPFDEDGNFIAPDARDTLGNVVDLNLGKDENGNDGVYANIAAHGDDSLRTVARNGRSIGIASDLRDDKGHLFKGEALHHLAILPNPALTNLGGTSKIAASADVFLFMKPFTAAPSRRSFSMTPELATQVRAKLGLGADVPDTELDSKTAEKALALSADLQTITVERDTLKEKVKTVETERDAKKQEVLALSAGDPTKLDAVNLSAFGMNADMVWERNVEKGAMTGAEVLQIKKLLRDAGGRPTRLALSASGDNGYPLEINLARLIGGFATPLRTGHQKPDDVTVAEQLALSGDPANPPKTVTPEREKHVRELAGLPAK